MKTKIITIGVLILISFLLIILSGCYIKKYAEQKVKNEELTLKLNNANIMVKDLQKSFEALQQVEIKTDTIIVTTTETNIVVKESLTTLDTIVKKIDNLQKDINYIKRLLNEKN